MALVTPSPTTRQEDVTRALDPSVGGAELVALAAHRDVNVRAAVASRTDAPMASLISLAHERDAKVLLALAHNPSSPVWVIKKLALERRSVVRELAEGRLAGLQES